MPNNHYNKKLKPFARELRNKSTKAEIRIWCELLRDRQLLGCSFLRQRPILNYIADFFCKDIKLVIEIDGLTHEWGETVIKDEKKDMDLNNAGYFVLRFTDKEIMEDINNVRRTLENVICERTKSLYQP
jgi:very-short-patch-repair endonuclease